MATSFKVEIGKGMVKKDCTFNSLINPPSVGEVAVYIFSIADNNQMQVCNMWARLRDYCILHRLNETVVGAADVYVYAALNGSEATFGQEDLIGNVPQNSIIVGISAGWRTIDGGDGSLIFTSAIDYCIDYARENMFHYDFAQGQKNFNLTVGEDAAGNQQGYINYEGESYGSVSPAGWNDLAAMDIFNVDGATIFFSGANNNKLFDSANSVTVTVTGTPAIVMNWLVTPEGKGYYGLNDPAFITFLQGQVGNTLATTVTPV